MSKEEITSSLQNPLGFVGKIVPSRLLKEFGIDRCFLFSCLIFVFPERKCLLAHVHRSEALGRVGRMNAQVCIST